MSNFIFTFGTGKEIVNIEIAGTDMQAAMNELKSAGWQTEEITNAKKVV